HFAQSDHLGGVDVRVSVGPDGIVLRQAPARVLLAVERGGELRIAPGSVDRVAAGQPRAAPAHVPRDDGDLLSVLDDEGVGSAAVEMSGAATPHARRLACGAWGTG